MRVSILIPTHARPDQLRHALASVAAQDLSLIGEVLVSDDSPDEYLAANREAVEASGLGDRVRYWCNRPSLGNTANHWKLASEAREDHLMILHDDDALYLGALTELANACTTETDPRVKLWFGTQLIMDEQGNVDAEVSRRNDVHYGRDGSMEHRPAWEWALKQSIPPNGYIVEADVYRAHMRGDRDGNINDWAFIVRLANAGVWARFLGRVVSYYRVQEASETSAGRGTDVHLAFEQACMLKVPPEHENEKLRHYYNNILVIVVRYARDGERIRAWRAFLSKHLSWRRRLTPRGAAVLAMLLTPRFFWMWALRYKSK